MTFRLVATPLPAPIEAPVERAGGFPRVLLPALVHAPGTEAAIAQLDAPDTLVVTTGQQPALFTGPLYSVHKALAAAGLARTLAERWDRPVVPVFWSAGDDHDWEEANHASWPDGEGGVRTVRLRHRPADQSLTPLWRELVGPEVEAALATLASDISGLPHGPAAVEWLRRYFRPTATLAAASTAALAELLAPFGIVVLDSTHLAVKRAATPFLLRALAVARDLDRDLAARAAELIAAGQDPGVAVGDGASLVMIEGHQGRDRLVSDGGNFITRRGRERHDMAALERIAATSPERFSANVLLRPALESALLPTVAYVAGPGELRYLRLTPPVYERLDVPQQRPVPRWSGLIVDARVDRALAKLDLTLDELLGPAAPLEARLLRPFVPGEAIDALHRLREVLRAEYGRLEQTAQDLDPPLVRTVAGARRRSLGEAERLEAKLLRAVKRRESTVLRQLARARADVMPLGRPQERVTTVAPLLARHGPVLLDRLRDTMATWYADALEGRLVPS